MVTEIAEPVAAELVRRGSPFSGLLYVGLAITSNGPAVVEFNCRFGDPETQAVLALLESPLGQLLHAAATGTLADFGELRWRDGAAVTVVLAAENYPGRPGSATSSSAPRPTGCCTPERPAATTARSCRRAVACCRWWAPEPIWPQRARSVYEILRSIRLPGSHFRSDIGLRRPRARSAFRTP